MSATASTASILRILSEEPADDADISENEIIGKAFDVSLHHGPTSASNTSAKRTRPNEKLKELYIFEDGTGDKYGVSAPLIEKWVPKSKVKEFEDGIRDMGALESMEVQKGDGVLTARFEGKVRVGSVDRAKIKKTQALLKEKLSQKDYKIAEQRAQLAAQNKKLELHRTDQTHIKDLNRAIDELQKWKGAAEKQAKAGKKREETLDARIEELLKLVPKKKAKQMREKWKKEDDKKAVEKDKGTRGPNTESEEQNQGVKRKRDEQDDEEGDGREGKRSRVEEAEED